MIYGFKSCGNQTKYALRETWSKSQSDANKVIHKGVYVDNCLSDTSTKEKAMQLADEIQIVLSRGGFPRKGFTFSGEPPLELLSSNNKSINVWRMKLYPQDDRLSYDITELNFNKKYIGKRLQYLERNKIPKCLTHRQFTI